MARNNLTELSPNAAENTDVQGVNINEGMSPGGVNNAMRAITAMLADAFALAIPNTKLRTVKAEKLLAADDGDVVQVGTTSPTTMGHDNTTLTTTIDAERNLTLEVGTQQNAGTLKVEEHDATLGKITVLEQSNNGGLVVGNTSLNAQRAAAGDTTPAMTIQGTISATTFVGDGSQLTGVATGTSSNFPVGGIIMWSGSQVPSGWALCDGTNGTPNLVNRFIMGASSSGSTGGANDQTLIEANLPAHTHDSGSIGANHSHSLSGSGNSHSHGAGTLSIGNHTHSDGSLQAASHTHPRPTFSWSNVVGTLHFTTTQVASGTGKTVINGVSQTQAASFSLGANTGSRSADVSGTTSNPSNTTLSGSTQAEAIQLSGSLSAPTNMTGTSGSTGAGLAFDNRPAFYAMAFIQYKGS